MRCSLLAGHPPVHQGHTPAAAAASRGGVAACARHQCVAVVQLCAVPWGHTPAGWCWQVQQAAGHRQRRRGPAPCRSQYGAGPSVDVDPSDYTSPPAIGGYGSSSEGGYGQGDHAGSASAAQAMSEWDAEIEETLKLVQLLPPSVRAVLEGHERLYELLEVVMDLGRPPTARFPGADERLAVAPVTQEDLDYAVTQVGAFGGDNRAGIDATLHRISCLRNRAGRIVGLTCRVGRAIHGSAGLVADLVCGGASVLFMGRPGVGKTTAIRELSRLLADDLGRRVVIVDTSNEIGGDGDVPHAGIGRARRMQVPDPDQQHRVMIEAVENHMPQVVVIDEIGTEAECSAARTIAQRGVQLVATAHGNELQNLVKNPALSDLIGGIQSVTLGDDEAKRRGVQKSILERAAPPTFDVAVEMLERSRWCVYTDVAAAVDCLLGGQHPGGQVRERAPDGSITKYTFRAGSSAPGGAGSSSSGSSGAPDSPLFGRRGSSGSSSSGGSGGSSRSVLPDLMHANGSGERGDGASPLPGVGGFLRPRVPLGRADAADDGSPFLTRRASPAPRPTLGCASPEGAALRLFAAELDEERLAEVMGAMGLHDKVFMAPRPAEADAVLAVRSRLRSNPSLRAAARDAGVPVYAIKSSSSSNLVRAFRTLLGLEPTAGGPPPASAARSSSHDDALRGAAAGSVDVEGTGASSGDESGDDADEQPEADAAAAAAATAATGGAASSAQQLHDAQQAQQSAQQPAQRGGPVRAMLQEEEGLEEARLAALQIVMPLQQPVELLPRPAFVRQAQAAQCERYGLAWEEVGTGAEARVRICPAPSSSQQQQQQQEQEQGAARLAKQG